MKFSFGRPVTSYGKVRRLVTVAIRNSAIQKIRLKRHPARYLNIGCGANVFSGYINIDSEWRPGIDLCWDITRRMPISKDTVEGIFTEHCLEHISCDQCLLALQDLHEILKPGGTLRIVVPDAGMYLDLYQQARSGQEVRFPTLDESGEPPTRAPAVPSTPMAVVNSIFRDFGHQYAYDFETLQSMLRHAGFKQVLHQSFRAGRDPRLLMDSAYRRPQSLYVEAVK